MRKLSLLGIIILVVIPFTSLLSQENDFFGLLVYSDGDVVIHSEGDLLEDPEIGMEILQYDLIETGEDGTAEIELTSPYNEGTTIKISENTAFYFDEAKIDGKNQTRFQMMMGTLTLQVQKISGNGGLTVQTQSAAMGVRGTEFSVIASPEGSLLVTCKTGKVACRNRAGKEWFVEPGVVAEQDSEDRFISTKIPVSDLGNFESKWQISKNKVFRTRGLELAKFNYKQYILYRKQFVKAYQELTRHREIFRRWVSKTYKPSLGQAIKDKQIVSAAVFKMRRILYQTELVLFRLDQIGRLYRQGFVKGELKKGYNAARFFAEFARQRRDFSKQLSFSRLYFRAYVKISRYVASGASVFGEQDDPFFEDLFMKENPFMEGGEIPTIDLDNF